ncbi:MAG: hypothetical protein ABFD84_16750, partial [Candidatus Polarisedimenticolia bacterium]
MKRSEEDLARAVVAWLQLEGWTVWQEVTPCAAAPVCDIVARRGPVIWAIECKAAPSLEVLDQASRWVGRANYVSVAVPTRRSPGLYLRFAASVGLGVLWVDGDFVTDHRGPFFREPRGAARARARYYFELRELLTEERRLWPAAAGNARSERFTDFRAFCHGVRDEVYARPGISVRETIARLKSHHYASDASARSCLASWARAGKVPDVRISWRGRTPVLWPAVWTDEQIEKALEERAQRGEHEPLEEGEQLEIEGAHR